MDSKLNLYGDIYIKTTGTHGSDISSQRLDDLDKKALIHSLETASPRVLDIGCGFGAQSIRFAMNGASVTAVDIVDVSEKLGKEMLCLGIKNDMLRFVTQDICSFLVKDEQVYDIIYSQRFIHYLPYDKACELVKMIYTHTKQNGRVFFSASGMSSELSTNYDCSDSIVHRFSKLENNMAQKHGILEPVCLYHKEELSMLFEQHGFVTDSIWTSTFGNVKGIFSRK